MICAIPDAAPAIPENPSAPAINAIMNKYIIVLNIVIDFILIYKCV